MAKPQSRTESIFWAALAMPTPQERAHYLDETCAGDQELRAQIEELLAAYPKVERFLEAPAADRLLLGEEESRGAATVNQPALSATAGTVIGPYKLLEMIGEGGMGTVWMAQQTEPVKRTVAVKLIKPGMDSKQVLARFEAERQALALMDHPNIAKVLDAGTLLWKLVVPIL